jgi:lipopolysaccharide/colanic/teichoic acid biosynthesis glycosyltransferase
MIERHTAWQRPFQAAVLTGGRDRALYFRCKRWLDVVLATLLLVLVSPLMLLIAVLIKLDTPGPVIFVQERVGARRRRRDGRTVWDIRNFPFYKFRSMIQDADPSIHQAHIKAYVEGYVGTSNAGRAKFKLTDDPRVTRVGRILRQASLDELPQLVNVLKGEMSLVGPRPVPPYEVAEYQPWHCERLATLPGITGLWQVNGRCQVSFEEQIRMDIEYVHNQSLWLDLRILFLTIPAVLSGRGAE